MTIYQIIERLKDIAQNTANINYTGNGDIYSLNSKPDINYGVFFITENAHRINKDNITYSLNLYYVDRLMDDMSNLLNIENNALINLINIVNKFSNENDVTITYPYSINFFTEKFSDMCGGGYITIDITVVNDLGLCDY